VADCVIGSGHVLGRQRSKVTAVHSHKILASTFRRVRSKLFVPIQSLIIINFFISFVCCRSDVQVHSDVFIPSLNGSAGAFVAVRVDRGSCDAVSATGLFFTVFAQNGTFQVTSDLGMFTSS